MGLFSKDKNKQDLKQTQEIKDVSNEFSHTNPPISPNPFENTSQTSPEPNNFYNPFTENKNTQQPQNPLPTIKENPIPQTNIPPIEELNPNFNQQPQNPTTNSIFQTQEQKSTLPSDTKPQPQTPNPTTPTSAPLETQNSLNISRDQIQEIVDETVEQVIEERWKNIIQKIEKVAAWKEKQEAHINLIKEDIVTMKNSFEKLEKRILDKVSSYDRNILDVNSEIKALEKVFQKITPTLVNNVNELSKIAKTFKDDSETEKIE